MHAWWFVLRLRLDLSKLKGPQKPAPTPTEIAARMEALGIANAASAYTPDDDLDEEELIVAQAMDMARLERGGTSAVASPATGGAAHTTYPSPVAASGAASAPATWDGIANAEYEGSDAEIAAMLAAAQARVQQGGGTDGAGGLPASLLNASAGAASAPGGDAGAFLSSVGVDVATLPDAPAGAAPPASAAPGDADAGSLARAQALLSQIEKGGYAAAGKTRIGGKAHPRRSEDEKRARYVQKQRKKEARRRAKLARRQRRGSSDSELTSSSDLSDSDDSYVSSSD